MNVYMRFPDGKTKALTLSYDDGVEQDIHLVEIMKRNGLKGTFNLNSGIYTPEGYTYPEGTIHRRMTRKQCVDLFKDSGMEVAVHSLTHPFLEKLPNANCNYEVLQDRINLEKDFDVVVRGMAYPYGTYSDEVIEVLKQCGIVYSRTVIATENFEVPTDWLRMPTTCHHNHPRLMELAKIFVEENVSREPLLYYLWGHSYEFDEDNNWNVIETFAEYLGNRDDIWYATNIEIYEYVEAYRQLVFNVDGDKVYNPTALKLYFQAGSQVVSVKPGETITLG